MKFGHYPKTSNGEVQPIEWQVLEKENNKMFVISKYGLDAKRFDGSSNNWGNSEIRKWLNNEFYNKAFNEKEKKSIKSSKLSDVGTTDNVFLLSKEEAEKYFANKDARLCKATDYAKNNGASVWSYNGCSYWCLRSPHLDFSDYVYFIYDDGCIDYGVLDDDVDDVECDSSVVRPVLWINL